MDNLNKGNNFCFDFFLWNDNSYVQEISGNTTMVLRKILLCTGKNYHQPTIWLSALYQMRFLMEKLIP